MTKIDFVFPLANGLHARPASLLQEICLGFDAHVRFRNRRSRRRADAGSVLELVASGTAAGDPCVLEVSGPQEAKAARSLCEFLESGLLQADDGPPPASPPRETGWLPPVFRAGARKLLRGQGLSSGSGRGVVVPLKHPRSLPKNYAAGRKDAAEERRLFRSALEKAQGELRLQAAGAPDGVAAAVMKAHLSILCDPGFGRQVEDLITGENLAAGKAIARTAAAFSGALRRSPSAYMRERAGDLEDIAAQLGEKLFGPAKPKAPPSLRSPGVVVAAALSPSELLGLERRNLRGLILGQVGFTSHAAILARSLAIPAVSLPPAQLAGIAYGVEVIVDGRRGLAIVSPGTELKRYYRLEQPAAEMRRQRLARLTRRPATTRDKVRVEIAANIGTPAELAGAWRNAAEGIGLFRSEFLFLGREAPPSEEEQLAAYLQAARSAKGATVIVRTLDVGGDKTLPYLHLGREENPYLGFRAVRFYAEQSGLIRCQLRALLRAARLGRLKIMVPMVTTTEEVRLVRRLLTEAAGELRQRRVRHAPAVDLGIMVETPAAALSLDALGREADFFSIGSNDLLQYFLAVDRGNARLADLYDPLHPAFLRLLSQAAGQARRARRWLGLCGEMAGRVEYLPLLVGLGFNGLSMAPDLIPGIKARLGQLDGGECRALLRRCLRCAEAADVARRLREFNGRGSGAGVIAAELVRLGSKSRTPSEAIKELCSLLERSGRVENGMELEEAVWKREETYATDLGFGFALPHAKAAGVRQASIAFLRSGRPIRWSAAGTPVRCVLLIAVPERAQGEEHLKLIARLSRRLMHEEFRRRLLAAKDAAAVVSLVNGCLRSAL
ncbi:MAG: phosphoenolpyruvate--protein phosphotransferase [Candidatus Aminicenantes bacterium]|nr:phosphoenolpyruvate--protein phosphotransferase [Candidatus Aminicenantes bacterium]